MSKNPDELVGLEDFGVVKSSELTPGLTFKHFKLLAAELTWMETTGKELLEKPEALDRETWSDLFERSFQIYCAGGGCFTFLYQFIMVVERGISDLRRFTEEHLEETRVSDSTARTLCWSWFQTIEYQLRMGARLGFQERMPVDPKITLRLLCSLLEIAKLAKINSGIEAIATDLFPNYLRESREMFVSHHKNW